MFTHVHALLHVCASRSRLILLRERVACYTKSAYCPILYSTIFAQITRRTNKNKPQPQHKNCYDALENEVMDQQPEEIIEEDRKH